MSEVIAAISAELQAIVEAHAGTAGLSAHAVDRHSDLSPDLATTVGLLKRLCDGGQIQRINGHYYAAGVTPVPRRDDHAGEGKVEQAPPARAGEASAARSISPRAPAPKEANTMSKSTTREKILAVLPASMSTIRQHTKLTDSAIYTALSAMKKDGIAYKDGASRDAVWRKGEPAPGGNGAPVTAQGGGKKRGRKRGAKKKSTSRKSPARKKVNGRPRGNGTAEPAGIEEILEHQVTVAQNCLDEWIASQCDQEELKILRRQRDNARKELEDYRQRRAA